MINKKTKKISKKNKIKIILKQEDLINVLETENKELKIQKEELEDEITNLKNELSDIKNENEASQTLASLLAEEEDEEE